MIIFIKIIGITKRSIYLVLILNKVSHGVKKKNIKKVSALIVQLIPKLYIIINYDYHLFLCILEASNLLEGPLASAG